MKTLPMKLTAILLMVLLLPVAVPVSVFGKSEPDYKLYSDFLKQGEFLYKLKEADDSGQKTCGLTFYDTYGSKRYERKSITFCLLDLNDDGVKELMVARMGSNWEPKAMHVYAFTIKKGKVQFLKYMGSQDYSFRATGTKLQYSQKYKALYCPALVQNSDAYCDDEKETWSLYSMQGNKIVRRKYADSHVRHFLDGTEETYKTYHYQEGNTSELTAVEGEPNVAYSEYVAANFTDLDLKACRLYRNNSKNRKKLLGKA